MPQCTDAPIRVPNSPLAPAGLTRSRASRPSNAAVAADAAYANFRYGPVADSLSYRSSIARSTWRSRTTTTRRSVGARVTRSPHRRSTSPQATASCSQAACSPRAGSETSGRRGATRGARSDCTAASMPRPPKTFVTKRYGSTTERACSKSRARCVKRACSARISASNVAYVRTRAGSGSSFTTK